MSEVEVMRIICHAQLRGCYIDVDEVVDDEPTGGSGTLTGGAGEPEASDAREDAEVAARAGLGPAAKTP